MESDGANLGIKPERALKTILGGEKHPSKEEQLDPAQMRAEILSSPDEYFGNDGFSYDGSCMWLAKQFLLLLEAGIDGNESTLYNAMIEKCGKKDYGFTGYMVGWANNAARYAIGKPPQPNPAIMIVGGNRKAT